MEIHEQKYRELKTGGFPGWGGSAYADRMAGWDEQLSKLFSLLPVEPKSVLELGSGAGDVSLKVSRAGCQVTGIELSPTAVQWANEKASAHKADIRFICSSAADTNLLAGKKFDLIIDGNCLHCLFAENRTAFFDNVARLTKAGGHLFISSAVILDSEDERPPISSIQRCFVTQDAITENLERRGFQLTAHWNSHGSHRHFYGLFEKVNGHES